MSTNERIRMIRIIEKIERNKEYSNKVGIRSAPKIKKEREERYEVHRC